MIYRRLLLFALVALISSGCSLFGSSSQPTLEPIIIVASPTTSSGQVRPTATRSTLSPANTATVAAQATTTTNAPVDTPIPGATSETGTSKGTLVFAFDAFPTYYPGIIMEVRQLLQKRGYELQLLPFGLEGEAPPEAERWAKLRNGEWDVLATTLDGFARQSDASIGAITTVIDESAGADKLVVKPEITTLNDLRGKRISFSEGSVGEYFLYYALSLAGLTPQDVTLVGRPSVADAVAAFNNGETDAVSGWEPDILDAEQKGGQVLIASDKLRAILDVLISSRPALSNKAEALQAFHDAWYEALKVTIDTPDQAGNDIVGWGHPDWTFVAAPEDFRVSLEKLAQANLGANQIAFQSPQLLSSRLNEARGVWERAGQQPPGVTLTELIDGRFVQAAARQSGLSASQAPVNSSFLLTERVELPQLSEQDLQAAQTVVKLPLEKIDFQPESTRLTTQAEQDLINQVLPVLRSSRLYLKIEGSSAWPGPDGRFSQEDIRAFALSRATSVQTFLVQQGIDPNRLLIGSIDAKFPNSVSEEELAQDRYVRFTLVTTGGR